MGWLGRMAGKGWTSRMGKVLIVGAMLLLPAFPAPPALAAFPALSALHAQHAAFRVKGRVVTERGEPIDKADIRLEAFYGYAAGTFAGPRKLSAQSNAKGEWNVGALQPGIWLFEVDRAAAIMPETVVLPIRILTTVSMGTSGMSLHWDLVLKPVRAGDDVKGELLDAGRGGGARRASGRGASGAADHAGRSRTRTSSPAPAGLRW